MRNERSNLSLCVHGIAINRESSRMLLEVAKAIRQAQAGDATQARKSLAPVLEALDGMARAETAAECGQWKNWYRGDWLTGTYRTRQIAEILSEFLPRPAHPPVPATLLGWLGSLLPYHVLLR